MPSARKFEREPGLPLSALLSQALVAFIIECDNEFEHQAPHRTSKFGSSGPSQSPWLVSIVMWWNCLRFVGPEGVRVAELEDLARAPTNLNGMQRWGYVVMEPPPVNAERKPRPSDSLIRTTAKGRLACQLWQPLPGVVEERWKARFGKAEIGRLRESLCAIISRFPFDLPECPPILGYGLVTKGRFQVRPALPASPAHNPSRLILPLLLTQVLLAFAFEFEQESPLSLAISANVLRVLNETGVRIRDLPTLSGVSKESISMAMGILTKARFALIESEPKSVKAKVARLTAKGLAAQDEYWRLLAAMEQRWEARFGINQLRQALQHLVGDGNEPSPLFLGLEPYPDGWRASVRKPETLPHYPMVLHRGGFPDGS
jgi:hypothetical protein